MLPWLPQSPTGGDLEAESSQHYHPGVVSPSKEITRPGEESDLLFLFCFRECLGTMVCQDSLGSLPSWWVPARTPWPSSFLSFPGMSWPCSPVGSGGGPPSTPDLEAGCSSRLCKLPLPTS